MVGLNTENHGHRGDYDGDRQHRDEYPGALPQRRRVFLCGLQFGLLALLLGFEAVVLTPPGSTQEIAGGIEAVAETGFGGQGFGFNEPGAFQQPGFVAVAGAPVGGGALEAVGVFEVLRFVAQPGGQLTPLAQQAF